jgi:hypothetical protein
MQKEKDRKLDIGTAKLEITHNFLARLYVVLAVGLVIRVKVENRDLVD